jgi:hypothetical protein
MKKQFSLFCMTLIAATPICFAQASPSDSDKSDATEAAITDLEKSVTEAFKNKQAKGFKKYLARNFTAVDAQGIKNVDAEVADMEKTDVHDNLFDDVKVVFPSRGIAVITYKVTTHATSGGQDTSGTYNAATVWTRRAGNWVAVFHTFVKAQ